MDNQHKKIAGYRDLSEGEIGMMNMLKDFEADVAQLLGAIEENAKKVGDQAAERWVSLARTNLETGFMYAIKAVARPTTGLGRK